MRERPERTQGKTKETRLSPEGERKFVRKEDKSLSLQKGEGPTTAPAGILKKMPWVKKDRLRKKTIDKG